MKSWAISRTRRWKGKLADEQLRGLLVAADLAKGHGSRSVSVGLLDTSGGGGRLAGCLGGELLAGGLASGGLAGGLLGKGARQGRRKAPPQGPSGQHPGHHQARHSPPGSPGWCEAHQRSHLRRDPRCPQGFP